MNKKFLSILPLLFLVTPTNAAYEEIQCSTDSVFSEYSCNQCFDWGTKVEWDNLWLLTDLWQNVTDLKKILYKEEQSDPQMINLNSSNVTWTQVPDSNNFWEYTDEFNALYSDTDFWYVLEPGKSVTWLKSTLSHAFKLEKNSATKWTNIGLLVYPIISHPITADWEISMDNSQEHKECVLFKSWDEAVVVIPKEKPKSLPQTWPAEYLMLLILSFVLGFWVLKFRTRS